MKYPKTKILITIIIIYTIATIKLTITNIRIYTNIINPTFWTIMLIYLIYNNQKNNIKINKNQKYNIHMLIISIFYLILYFLIGFKFGFSKNPYKQDLVHILKNAIIQILPIISIEIIRNTITNSKNKILITTLLILVEINYNTLTNIYTNKEELYKYICSTIIPLITYNILYTYLTTKVTYTLPLIHRLTCQIPTLLLPIVPNINWFITGSIGIILPTTIYVIFKYKILKEKTEKRKRKQTQIAKISYTTAIILSITLVSFMLGIFKYEPITILSNSMNPVFSKGDIVIYKKLKEQELKQIPQNTIIIYEIENKNIAHRITKTIKQKDTTLYQTKGDSNNTPDMELVKPNQIKGQYIFHIKYIGLPSVWLYNYFKQNDTKVETNKG